MDKQSILIVEDDQDVAEMLGTYFLGDYEIVLAAWGEEALRLTSERDVSLVLLDIHLPDIDGYEVCRQLRLQRRTQTVPIIFLTEKSERGDKLQGLELGVVDYITKPFDIQELRLRVRNAITRVERGAQLNPVTQLPDVALTEDRLSAALDEGAPWAALLVRVGGLDALRELHGFVAADEVMRAITILVHNAMRESGAEDDFLGHLLPDGLMILTEQARIDELRDRVEGRIRPALRHFYPPASSMAERAGLTLDTRAVDADAGPFASVAAVRQKLLAAEPTPPG